MTTTKMYLYVVFATILSSFTTLTVMKKYNKTTSTNLPPAPICSDYNKNRPSTLEIKLIKEMTQKYGKNQMGVINNSLNIEDARCIWFSLDAIKEFSYHIENQFKKNNNTNATTANLGVRIYYSAYPEASNWQNFPDLINFSNTNNTKGYENLHTLIMVPTIYTKDANYDFDPLDANTYINGLDLNGASTGNLMSLGGGSTPIKNRTKSKNHGTLSPPAPPTGLSF